mgnify:CR=1 FL=1
MVKALEVQDVSKLYRLGNASEMVNVDDNALVRFIKRPMNNLRKYRSP